MQKRVGDSGHSDKRSIYRKEEERRMEETLPQDNLP